MLIQRTSSVWLKFLNRKLKEIQNESIFCTFRGIQCDFPHYGVVYYDLQRYQETWMCRRCLWRHVLLQRPVHYSKNYLQI